MKFTYDEQLELLNYCISNNIALENKLEKDGLSYDSLVYHYENYNQTLFPLNNSEKIEHIENLQRKSNNINTVSFFSGAGGLDLGFKYAGFSSLAAIENNPIFCETLRANKVSEKIIGPPLFSGDLKNREEITSLLQNIIGFSKQGFSGVFHGGPPCQSFSIAANQRFSKGGEKFKRNGFNNLDYGTLLFDYVHYIEYFRPTVFVIENVSGLLSVDDGYQLLDAMKQLSTAGYSITGPKVLNASDYGVPQNRRRVIIIGQRINAKLIDYPKPNTNKVNCGQVFAEDLSNLPNHETRKHKAESIIRYMELKYGEREHLGRVDRLDPYLPSKTVIAGGSNGGGRSHLHPYIPRTLSVRESAKLQTFPDNYIFTGTSARQFTQVGNAVPPLLAFKIAESIKATIF